MKKYFLENTDQLRQVVSNVSANFTFENLLPDIEKAAKRYLRNDMGIGKDLFDDYVDAYNDPEFVYGDAEELTQELIRLLRSVIGNFAVYHFLAKSPLTLGSSGATSTKTEGEEAPRMWMINGGRNEYLSSAFDATESLFDFLEEHEDDFLPWKNSEARKLHYSTIITNVSEFSKYYAMVSSRRTFVALRSVMDHVASFTIANAISPALYAVLQTEIKKNAPASNITALLPYIKPALVYATMAEGFNQLIFVIDEKGLQVLGTTSTQDSGDKSDSPSSSRVKEMETKANQRAAYFLSELRNFLYANASTYPEYQSSTQYTGIAATKATGNSGDSNIYMT